MKIITNHVAYIQKNDIAYLNQTDLVIPASIFMKVFGDGTTIINDSNRYEFVEFDAPEEIDFFKNIDWMIDYNEIKDLSEEEMISLGQSIAKERNSIAQKFNSMTEEQKEENMNIVTQCDLLDFKMYSLRDILWLKQGRIKMELPEVIDLTAELEQEKGIKNLIKTMFHKKKI